MQVYIVTILFWTGNIVLTDLTLHTWAPAGGGSKSISAHLPPPPSPPKNPPCGGGGGFYLSLWGGAFLCLPPLQKYLLVPMHIKLGVQKKNNYNLWHASNYNKVTVFQQNAMLICGIEWFNYA